MSPKQYNPNGDGSPVSVLKLALAEVENLAVKYRQAIHILESDGAPRASSVPSRKLPDRGHLPFLTPTETMARAAVKVLEAAEGEPLHIKELVARMIAAGFKNQNPKALRANITKTLERGKDFERVAPATYGLAKPGALKAAFPEGS